MMLNWSVAAFAATLLAPVVTANATTPATESPFPMPLCNDVNIQDLTVTELQRLLILGTLTSQDLVSCYTDRIQQTNEYLRSVSEVNPDAQSIATALDEEREAGNFRGPLHGIPFMVKDNIYTDDKHNTSEGGLVLLGGRYSSEATIVSKLRAAGAVLLGHAALSEAADHRALTNFSDGYSTRVGQTRNPFNLSQPTSGSSGGSVVAVRANQVPIAIGSETHGSLVHPSALLGLYTLKSTPGVVSRHGVVPGSYYHDTPGPVARSMRDVALVYDVIAAPDPLDNLTLKAVGNYPEDGYASHVVDQNALKGMKLGLPWNPYWSTISSINSPGQRDQYEKRVKQLQAAGAEIHNITDVGGLEKVANPYGFGQPADTPEEYGQLVVYNTLLDVAYAEWLQNWTFPEGNERYGMKTLTEMAAWNDAHNDTTGALGNSTWWFNTISGQDFYDNAIATNGTQGDAFWKAFDWGRRASRDFVDRSLVHVASDGSVVELDGLLVPNDPSGGFDNACSSIPSYAGYPIASVPIGQSGYSLPCGICIYGREYSEAKLIKVASAMEDLFQWDAQPTFANYDVAEGPWDVPWPGYACTTDSLEEYACERAE